MNFFEIILIAVALSMDAFAVSVTLGLSGKKVSPGQMLIPGIYFGGFQAIMPFIGFFAGKFFASKIQTLDHWVAFLLLSFIGAKMIKESFSKSETTPSGNTFGFTKMLLLAVATSIDALAVGITFSFFKTNIYMAITIIGITTCIISMAGVRIGNIFGIKYKSKAEFAGGIVLIALGLKILFEHLIN